MLLELTEDNILLTTLRKITLKIDRNLYINLIYKNNIPVFKFTEYNKSIYVTYKSIKFYRHEDIIYHAINMIRRKGNEKYFDKFRRSPFISIKTKGISAIDAPIFLVLFVMLIS